MINNETYKIAKVSSFNSVLGDFCFGESSKVAKVHSKNAILL